MDLKLSNVFLVGTEFGFVLGGETHAKDSFYNEKENEKRFEDFKRNLAEGSYKLEDNEFGEIYTTPFYNTSRSHAQRKIKENLK